ncbi:MAG TPA: TMEM175 family protein, partial [Acidimicrobiia bacterium]|nr:TMEM175 family protein [Acidimicrobiia bacterium]
GPLVSRHSATAYFAIAITLLVLELAIPSTGTPLERVLDAWPSYLAYVVSFLTIGAAWLAHTAITDRLANADSLLLRLNLLLLFMVSLLPFPTRLVAEGINDVSGERVFVAMYGVTLLGIRVLLYALDLYCRREHLYSPGVLEETGDVRRTIGPVVAVYVVAILIGLALPVVAVGLYCVIAVYLVVPFRDLAQLLFPRAN